MKAIKKAHSSVLLWLALISSIEAAEAPRPRGVAPECKFLTDQKSGENADAELSIYNAVAKFYKSTEAFVCISNPSFKLDASQVNDDYCDCPDGSDEPGTSACSYLSNLSPSFASDVSINAPNTSLALPGFYCKNKGHLPSYIPFLSVNDGVCDYDFCCDGSDEWAKVGGEACVDKCKEIGKEWRKHDEQRRRALSSAAKKRKELVAQASRLRKEIEDRMQTLAAEAEAAVIKVGNLQAALVDIEKREKGKVVKSSGSGSRISMLAGLAKDRIEELRGALVHSRAQRNAAEERIAELETILSTFKEEYNPNFNDEGVKRAVRSWEEYAAREPPSEGDAARDRDLDDITKSDDESGPIQWSEWEDPDESDAEALYKIEEYLPKPVRDWVDQKLRDLRVMLVENGILAGSRDSGSESKAVAEARDALRAAEDDLHNDREQLKTHQEDLDKDYGQDDVFRALQGQCVSKDSGEYVYELCWLDRTTQKPKKGGSDTGMGKFVRIDSITVDDEVPPDGKGLGSGERVALRYENGQHCWNGPSRSTLVVLACAEKDEVWKVSEEEKCVYRMEVGTPAVCGIVVVEGQGQEQEHAGIAKDEL